MDGTKLQSFQKYFNVFVSLCLRYFWLYNCSLLTYTEHYSLDRHVLPEFNASSLLLLSSASTVSDVITEIHKNAIEYCFQNLFLVQNSERRSSHSLLLRPLSLVNICSYQTTGEFNPVSLSYYYVQLQLTV